MTDTTDGETPGKVNWIAERDPVTGRIIRPVPKITTPELAREAVTLRWEQVEKAKWAGLEAAAADLQLDMREPADTIAYIVRKLAVRAATQDNRTGNEAGEIIFKVIGLLATGRPGANELPVDGLQVSMGNKLARDLLAAIADRRAGDKPVVVVDGGRSAEG